MRVSSCSPRGRRQRDPQKPDDPQDDPLKWPLYDALKLLLDDALKWPLDDHDPEDAWALLSVSRAGAK